jgi:predicted phage-related endonuclease
MRPDHKSYLGGSDAGPLMGFGYKTPRDVFALKTGEREPEDLSENEAVRWGTALEPFVLDEGERILGRKIERDPKFRRHPIRNYVGGHIDGLMRLRSKDRLIEAKTSMFRRFKGGLPQDIEWQCRHYLYLWDLDICHVIVAVLDKREFIRFDVERDPELEDQMLKVYDDFWKRVEEVRPPDPTRPTDEQYFQMEGEEEATEDDLSLVEELIEIREQLNGLTLRKNDTEETLKMSFINRGIDTLTLTKQGSPLVKWGKQERSSVDTKALVRKYPEIASELTKKTEYRTLKVL